MVNLRRKQRLKQNDHVQCLSGRLRCLLLVVSVRGSFGSELRCIVVNRRLLAVVDLTVWGRVIRILRLLLLRNLSVNLGFVCAQRVAPRCVLRDADDEDEAEDLEEVEEVRQDRVRHEVGVKTLKVDHREDNA
jgi:hypothetical protein